jgi:hypothetical protein
MQFSPSLNADDIAEAIIGARSIGTPAAWKKSVDLFRSEGRHNPFALHYFADRYAYELAMELVLRHRSSTARVPDIKRANINTFRLYSFAAMLTQVYPRLSSTAQKALAGRVRGGLTDTVGLEPIAFELLIAADLLQRGADVEWNDLESGSGFDFLVRRGRAEMEVECKTFGADIGRKVHRNRQYALSGLVHKDIFAALPRLGDVFIDVVVPGHFAGPVVEQAAIAIRTSLANDTDIAGPEPCAITVRRISATEIPSAFRAAAPTHDEIHTFLKDRFDCKSPSVLVLSLEGQIAFLSIRSSLKDDIKDGMYRQLKDGTRQFSGTRPAALCAHILDLSPSDIVSQYEGQKRGEPNLFRILATRLFSPNRPCLHTVQFTTPGRVHEHGRQPERHFTESGAVYRFTNSDHPLANDAAYQFR